MEPIPIPQLLRAPQKTRLLTFQENIADLPTLTPVKGEIQVIHGGTFLEVRGQAEAIVTLTCDRCLQHYNHRLAIEPQEIIWLRDRNELPEYLPPEQELDSEELEESLDPNGTFDPTTWIYEQLSLALPLRNLCNNDCPGTDLPEEANPLVDRRWSALSALKDQLP